MLKFNIGNVYMSRGIADTISRNEKFSKEVLDCFNKYIMGCWGNLVEEDIKANDMAIKNGDRILEAYNISQGKIYIITEADRSSTTILFANEY